jgi:HlyD family secretion protein
MRRISLPLIAFCLISFGCSRSQEDSTFSGTIELTEHLVGARVTGRIQSLTVNEGDTVQKGQLLGTLDRFDQARRDYERVLQIQKLGGASEQTMEQAALVLEDQQLISPVNGIVLTKIKEVGEVVAAGSPILDIGDRAELWIRIYVPEGVINRIRLGQRANIRVDGLAQAFPGRVIYVAPRAEFTPRNIQTPEERVTQTFAVKVSIDQPPAFLRPGVSADVVLESQPSAK